MAGYRYISADNHLNTHWLPADLWQARLPRPLRARGPRVVETGTGSHWTWEDRLWKRSAAGSSWDQLARAEFAAVDLQPGTLPPADPKMARRHMDQAGIYAAVFYGDTRKWRVEDPALRLAMYRAYNDFCLEISAAEPGRLIYLPNLPTADPVTCLEECRRVVAAGAGAVEFDMFGLGAPPGDASWEPFWEMTASQGIVVCSHTGHAAGTALPDNDGGRLLASHATSPFVAARPVADMIFGGVFERHPGLTWVMAESRIGWLPFLFAWMDRQVQVRPRDTSTGLTLLPSDYVRRNIRFTFEEDPVGARLLAQDWSQLADTVMWGCDYPHPQGVWPDPGLLVERMLAGIQTSVRNEILFGRAARLFRIPGTEHGLPAA